VVVVVVVVVVLAPVVPVAPFAVVALAPVEPVVPLAPVLAVCALTPNVMVAAINNSANVLIAFIVLVFVMGECMNLFVKRELKNGCSWVGQADKQYPGTGPGYCYQKLTYYLAAGLSAGFAAGLAVAAVFVLLSVLAAGFVVVLAVDVLLLVVFDVVVAVCAEAASVMVAATNKRARFLNVFI
jgi:hypothetical protein